jgi:predicted ATPase
MRALSIRCFDDIGNMEFSEKCNVFVGGNNSGKSTLLRMAMAFQGRSFDGNDFRQGGQQVGISLRCRIEPHLDSKGTLGQYGQTDIVLNQPLSGQQIQFFRPEFNHINHIDGQNFTASRPGHYIVPFLAKRRAAAPLYTIDSNTQNLLDGTVSNLVSRVDMLAVSAHPDHRDFAAALADVVGIEITTRGHPGGKHAGFYLNRDTFIAIEEMGDGITELVAMIVELVTERGKVFVIEEPEANLHPKSLKALLGLIKRSSAHNQFLISTHSNIVVRELSAVDTTKIFSVFKSSEVLGAPRQSLEGFRNIVGIPFYRCV